VRPLLTTPAQALQRGSSAAALPPLLWLSWRTR